ncbi:ABC transporter ATP-binding protein [Brooklawnia cerclae]|uniref:Peptide/nickel transport system ATP-binding protein n=1 Tax=Brooklawnia cerclae TaxID=349934 RepID=A0ABX0SK35_9ACTN|nr:ABC transporter ATP-binding protein [Brooklawnia cerclae]NIH58704.1 peptide/nickel transport system ATP-binding protein [Brooklawnia cerclae]NIH58828.1 peptide/nickel transport system ATP-binding protein [Brooklawnia cerclae]
MALLDVEHLSIQIPTEDGIIHAAQDISFSVEAGTLFGIVGESGSGKSVLTQAITGLLPGASVTGRALLDGEDLLALSPEELRRKRGSQIGMIFQDPLSTLHPFYKVGAQIVEAIQAHEKVPAREAQRRTAEMLTRVGIQPDQAFSAYPHQFSGGMRQRVMIAMALICHPQLVIADEPTTALDVTVQHQIIELLDEMRHELGTTIVMISHDLGLMATVADDLMVLYAGNRMETGRSEALFRQPAHPYTAGLLASSPSRGVPGEPLVAIPGRPPSLLDVAEGCVFADRCRMVMERCRFERPPVRVYDDGGEATCWLERPAVLSEEPAPLPSRTGEQVPTPGLTRPVADDLLRNTPIVEVSGVRVSFAQRGTLRRQPPREVLKGIDLVVHTGETVGLVGESGCGKSTLARVIAGLQPMDAGTVRLAGHDLSTLGARQWHQLRKEVQIVFQDPIGSLNPRRRVGAIIGDPFRIHHLAFGDERRRLVQHLMEVVGLKPEHYNRFPGEFSGGERQRIGIARALALNPSLIICDEPVSALDVSVQAQVLNLMKELQAEFGLSYLFISHDLAVVRHISDRIAVMDAGQIVELGDAAQVHDHPHHPFTRRLLEASMHATLRDPGTPRKLLVQAGERA